MASLPFELKGKTVYVAGHRGMVGSALVRRLAGEDVELLTATRDEADLRDQAAVNKWFAAKRPQVVFLAAAKVGGIVANNTYPVEFMLDNTRIALNTIQGAYEAGVKRLLFLGSTCIYPREAPQPMVEDCLLSGPLEPTNAAYALAKIAGLKLCQFYRQQYGSLFHSAMPTNLYGPGDNYHPDHSHVLPALIRRFHTAKLSNQETVTIWGTGKPRREFLHVDDLAHAVLHLLDIENPPDWINVGTGQDISIREAAEQVAETVGFQGQLVYDDSKPDGTPVKCTDISLLRHTGWAPQIGLDEGIRRTYQDFLSEVAAETLRSQ